MLNKKINALKLVSAMLDLHRTDENKPRMSLLDAQVLLLINEHKELGKTDMMQYCDTPNSSKSFLDKPVQRLLKYRLLEMVEHEGVNTQNGEARRTYIISDSGQAFLSRCAL